MHELGGLSGIPVGERPDLVADATLAAIDQRGLLYGIAVVEIDPALSDTAATREAYDLQPDTLANCVIVAGRREGNERVAACVVLATTRADVNGVVRRLLDVRKASFLPTERAVELTSMEYGGITPIGLPASWPVFVDRQVTDADLVVIGSGVRRSKLIVPGALIGDLDTAVVVDGLGI